VASGSTASLARRIYETSHLTGSSVCVRAPSAASTSTNTRSRPTPACCDVAQALVDLLPGGVELLAGLELGGIPLATVASQLTGLPTMFVRKEAEA
jgi:orotate phosphoribosyltransferase